MARIGKLTKNSNVVYPLTIADAVVFPNSLETLPEVIGDMVSIGEDDGTGGIVDTTSGQQVDISKYALKTWVLGQGYLTQHQDISGKANTADLATVATSGNYNDLTNKPTIPSVTDKADKVANATSGNLAGLDANGNLTDSGKKATDFQATLVSGTNLKTINNQSLLGSGNISISGGGGGGEANVIESISVNGTTQEVVDKNVDITVPTELLDLSDDASHRLVTDTEKSTWNGKQDALASGTNIKTVNNTSLLGSGNVSVQPTLVSGTNIKTINNQSLLGSGNINIEGGGGSGEENVIEVVKVNGTALTPDVNKAVDVIVPTESTVSGWGFTKNTGTYSKPSGGIPKTDLESSVQTSLGKADTALQSYTETDPTVPSWAKASSKPSYTASEVGAVPTSRTVNGKALSENISLTASDVGAVSSSDVVTIYSGSSAPSSSLGKNGDIYIRTS